MGRNFFNGTDAGLYSGAQAFSTKILASPALYGLNATQAQAFTPLMTAYSTAYLAVKDPSTRTRGKVAAKNQARANLKAMASDLAKIIDATPAVTDQQKIDLGLNVRKPPSPIPAPAVRPAMDLVSVVTRTVTVHIHDSASKTKRGKPAGTVAAFVYTFVGDNYPSDPTTWQFQGPATKAIFSIVFPDSVAGGAQVWVCAAWVNRRGDTGPVSVPISTNVQGGGVSPQTANVKLAA